MRPVVLFVALAACVPDSDTIGREIWSRAADIGPRDLLRAGVNGHVALSSDAAVQMLSPDGSPAWSFPLPGFLIDLAIDDAGGASILYRTAPFGGSESDGALARVAADGTTVWIATRRLPKTAMIVRDGEGATWVITSLPDMFPRWERVDANGAVAGGGELAFRMARRDEMTGAALPGGGIVIPDEQGGVTAVDAAGAYAWSLGASSSEVISFVLHEDGEITLRQRGAVARFDATHARRWSEPIGSGETVIGLADGTVIAEGLDGLDDDLEIPTLVRYGRDGALQREVFREPSWVSLVPGPTRDGYAIHVSLDERDQLQGRSLE